MSYRVEFTEKALLEFSRLPKKVQKKLSEEITALTDDPRPAGARKIKGRNDCYRLRQGDYRLVYAVIDAMLFILIVRAGHRKDVYKGMESLANRIAKFRESEE